MLQSEGGLKWNEAGDMRDDASKLFIRPGNGNLVVPGDHWSDIVSSWTRREGCQESTLPCPGFGEANGGDAGIPSGSVPPIRGIGKRGKEKMMKIVSFANT